MKDLIQSFKSTAVIGTYPIFVYTEVQLTGGSNSNIASFNISAEQFPAESNHVLNTPRLHRNDETTVE